MLRKACLALAVHPAGMRYEGGHVPPYQTVQGRVIRRNWVSRNPSWCDLCKEPISQWVTHIGRKDHALLDAHYEVLVHYPRSWDPKELLSDFVHYHGLPIEQYHAVIGNTDKERRNTIYSLLEYLAENKVVSCGDPRQLFLAKQMGGLRGPDFQGALVVHEFLLPTMLRLYPNEQIQNFSNFVDFISCGYNMETVYDLCGFARLDKISSAPIKASSPAALGLGGAAAASTATTGFQSEAPLSEMESDSELEDTFSRKATFLRSIMGQLRWTTQYGKSHPADLSVPAHLEMTGELLVKYLVAEIIVVRICEYVVRSEPVWREHGMERLKHNPAAAAKRPVTPKVINSFYRPMSPKLDDFYDEKAPLSFGKKKTQP